MQTLNLQSGCFSVVVHEKCNGFLFTIFPIKLVRNQVAYTGKMSAIAVLICDIAVYVNCCLNCIL